MISIPPKCAPRSLVQKNKQLQPNHARYGLWMQRKLYMCVYSLYLSCNLLKKRIQGMLGLIFYPSILPADPGHMIGTCAPCFLVKKTSHSGVTLLYMALRRNGN